MMYIVYIVKMYNDIEEIVGVIYEQGPKKSEFTY